MFHPHTGLLSLIVALASVSLISGLIYIELQDPSPGRLAAVHMQVPQLDGGKNCAACHGAPGSLMSDACTQCHREIADQLGNGTGLHGNLPVETRVLCSQCHSEHHGETFALTQIRSFALAGIDDISHYDHADLGFKLEGAHQQLVCTACHKHAAAAMLPIGSQRFLGLRQDCQSCHQDVHGGQLGTDCGACHGQSRPFDEAPLFQHTAAFPLAGSHSGLQCRACHAHPTEPSVASLQIERTAGTAIAARQCGDCHDSSHSPELIDAVTEPTGLPDSRSCEVCHSPLHASFRRPHAAMPLETHAEIGFPLGSPHDQVECQQCHPTLGTEGSIRVDAHTPRRLPGDCQACHGDPHGGQFVAAQEPRGAACTTCHFASHFVPSSFDVARHALTAFPLRGVHANLSCDACHGVVTAAAVQPHAVTSDAAVRRFRGTPNRCATCHPNPHQGQFSPEGIGASDCRACHDEHSFHRTTMTLEQHRRTRFPLDGAHVAVSCIRCHSADAVEAVEPPAVAKPDREFSPHRFLGTPTRCDACHADVHQGAFRQLDPPDPQGPAADCSACHTTDSFDRVEVTRFDHAGATGFELKGAHRELACNTCHPARQQPDERGRSFGMAAGRNCQDCHSQPHGDQFGPPAEVRCADCHNEEHDFQTLTFDHQRDARFTLDQVHSQLECSACHRPYRQPDGDIVVRYQPLGTRCVDCHLPPARSQPRGRRP